MDLAFPFAARLREARLQQIEALEAALACAENAIAQITDPTAANRMAQEVAHARAEAHALHCLFNIGA